MAASIMDEATKERELRPLLKVPDPCDKVLLTIDKSYIKDFQGIKNRYITQTSQLNNRLRA